VSWQHRLVSVGQISAESANAMKKLALGLAAINASGVVG
jgi:hypothetical protein